MSIRLIAADVPATSDDDSVAERRRFEAFVRALDELADAGRPRIATPDLDDGLPTRRINRTRKLLGDAASGGKSRRFARRLR